MNYSREQGLGLGIPLSQSYIHALDGDMQLACSPGLGMHVFLRLPPPPKNNMEDGS
jgi:C4-dicarboxylate-specific signal transduction histidine kinase